MMNAHTKQELESLIESYAKASDRYRFAKDEFAKAADSFFNAATNVAIAVKELLDEEAVK